MLSQRPTPHMSWQRQPFELQYQHGHGQASTSRSYHLARPEQEQIHSAEQITPVKVELVFIKTNGLLKFNDKTGKESHVLFLPLDDNIVVMIETIEKQIHVHKPQSEENKKSFMIKRREEIEERILEHVGFTSVIELLVESRKKLVGHNCFFDLLFMYSHFIEYIPEDYQRFKLKLSESFPE